MEKIRRVVLCLPDKYKDIEAGVETEDEYSVIKAYQINDKYPDVYDHIVHKIDNSWGNADKLFAEAIEKKLIKDVPLVFIRLMIIGCTVQFITSKEVMDTGLSYEEVMESMMSVIMAGIVL